jgi:hypothetical protein
VNLVTIAIVATATMSAVAAIGSWRSAKASAFVDQERRRAELRPQLVFRIAVENDDCKTAVMYVTLKGPADLPTPGKVRLSIMDLPSDLRDQSLRTLSIGSSQVLRFSPTFRFSRSGISVLQIWSPWEFAGGLKPLPRVARAVSWGFGSWTLRIGYCRPTRWFPAFTFLRDSAMPASKHKRRRVIAYQVDGVLFKLTLFVGQRTRTMRRVQRDEVQAMRLSRTTPPAHLGDLGKDWTGIYPPSRYQIAASCKFGKWRWRIEQYVNPGQGGQIADGGHEQA